jgi:hypothetical protein
MSQKQRSRFTAHLLRIAAYIAIFSWLALVYVGWVLVSTPESGKHPHLVGGTILVAAVAAMIVTMNHWVKHLQVIFGGFILGSLLAIGSGHFLNGSPVSRPIAGALTALFVGYALISRALSQRKLRTFDRVALIAFLAAFVAGLVRDTPIAGLVGLGVGFGFLFAAWVHDRLSSIPNRESEGTARHS